MFTLSHETPAQKAILHIASSIIRSFLMSLVIGTGQYLIQHGNFTQTDVQGLLQLWGAAFLGCLTMLDKSILSSPQLPQAVSDTLNQLLQGHARLHGLVSALIDAVNRSSQSPVVQTASQSQPQAAQPVISTQPTVSIPVAPIPALAPQNAIVGQSIATPLSQESIPMAALQLPGQQQVGQ